MESRSTLSYLKDYRSPGKADKEVHLHSSEEEAVDSLTAVMAAVAGEMA